jgi:hypothetical protein
MCLDRLRKLGRETLIDEPNLLRPIVPTACFRQSRLRHGWLHSFS